MRSQKLNKNIFEDPSDEGYILIPRKLIRLLLANRNRYEMCKEEAFLTMLYLSFYTDSPKSCPDARRGESELTLEEWSKAFCWTIWKVRTFLRELEQENEIEWRAHGKKKIIRIVNYELFCANKRKKPNQSSPVNKNDELFETFWKDYHDLTHKEPEDITRAKRIWKRMPLRDKHLAIKNIYSYVMKTEYVKYLKKAANYLGDKAYLE